MLSANCLALIVDSGLETVKLFSVWYYLMILSAVLSFSWEVGSAALPETSSVLSLFKPAYTEESAFFCTTFAVCTPLSTVLACTVFVLIAPT